MHDSRPYFVQELLFKLSKDVIDEREDIFRYLCIYQKIKNNYL